MVAGSGPAGHHSADGRQVNPPHGDAAVGRGLTVWSCSHRMVTGPTLHREAGRGGRDRIRTTWAGYDGFPGAGRLRCQHRASRERTPGRGWGNEDIHASGAPDGETSFTVAAAPSQVSRPGQIATHISNGICSWISPSPLLALVPCQTRAPTKHSNPTQRRCEFSDAKAL